MFGYYVCTLKYENIIYAFIHDTYLDEIFCHEI